VPEADRVSAYCELDKTASEDTRTTCLWKRASSATMQGHKGKKHEKNPLPSHSCISDTRGKETQTLPYLI